ncbi:MAG TPA: hypothetical protein VFV90_00645, partial [Usitatibacter sp.]|nr:hypothetical protein [Usitatibacter sp.]
MLAARQAGKIERAAGGWHIRFELMGDSLKVLPRRILIAPAEQDLVARLDPLADRDQLVLGVDAHQVARRVVAGVGPRDGDADQHVSLAPDDFLENLERGPPIQRGDDVLVARGDAKAPREGHAALREARGHRGLGLERGAGHAAGQHGVGDLHGARARARQPADQVAARHLGGHVGHQPGNVGRGRVGVHDGEVPAFQGIPPGKDGEAVDLGHHGDQCRLLLVLGAGGEHADADA